MKTKLYGLECYDEITEFTPEQQQYLILKYKLPGKVDAIRTAVDHGNPWFRDRACKITMAKLQDGSYFVIDAKYI